MSITVITSIIFSLIGGLGLFLYGMKLMSEGLQKSSGSTLKMILGKLTSNRFIGTGVGAIVTVIVQSSSVTTVMVVGFVNAGLMSLTQALSVILGANVGTTITAQIIAFKITVISLPCIGIGVLMLIFGRTAFMKYLGEIIFGFGLLFFGMDIMTKAFLPLSKSDGFRQIFVYFSFHPLLAVLTGAVTTFIVQSSSATIGLTIALATTGVLDFPTAAAFVLGENIGTTVTANLAALGASRVAKQAALGHLLINVIGVAYMLVFLNQFIAFVDWITPENPAFTNPNGTKPYIARHIANIHTMFNLINTFIFLPFLSLLAKLCERLIPMDKDDKELPKFVHLSDELMQTPEIAVGVVENEVIRMLKTSVNVLEYAKSNILNKDLEAVKHGKELHKHIEIFHKEIMTFLHKLNNTALSDQSKADISKIAHAVEETMDISERSEKLFKISQKIHDRNIAFTEDAERELIVMFDKVYHFAFSVSDSYLSERPLSINIENEEDTIDKLRKEFKKNHLSRLNKRSCSIDSGLLFVDLINTLEKIADNIYSITQSLRKFI